jgi:hypothetical protein
MWGQQLFRENGDLTFNWSLTGQDKNDIIIIPGSGEFGGIQTETLGFEKPEQA